jgi:hypothetical protein
MQATSATTTPLNHLPDAKNGWSGICWSAAIHLIRTCKLIGLDQLVPSFNDAWGGALVLGGISLSFWMIYLTDRARWWPVIPAGVLLTVAALVMLSQQVPGQDLGWVIFLGMALRFGLVYLLPTGEGRNRWAIYPAAVMLGMALLLMTTMGQVLNILWPVAFILAGLYIAYRRLRLLPS